MGGVQGLEISIKPNKNAHTQTHSHTDEPALAFKYAVVFPPVSDHDNSG